MKAYHGKTPVLGWSLHMTGWQGQFNRAERWYLRSKKAKNEDDQLDYLLAFFQNSFSLRDWLIHTGAVQKTEIDSLFSAHVELRINRDLANCFKHYTIDRPSQEQPPCLMREYAPENPTFGDDCKLIVLSEGVKYDALSLANRCLGIWRQFVSNIGTVS